MSYDLCLLPLLPFQLHCRLHGAQSLSFCPRCAGLIRQVDLLAHGLKAVHLDVTAGSRF